MEDSCSGFFSFFIPLFTGVWVWSIASSVMYSTQAGCLKPCRSWLGVVLSPADTGWVSSEGISAKKFWKSPWQTRFPFEASEFDRKLFSSLAQERSVCYWETGENCQQKYLCLPSIYLFIFCLSPCLPAFLKPPTLANEEIHSTVEQPSVKGSFLLSSSK